MKKFKTLRKQINESHNEPGVGSTRQGRYQVDKKDPETIAMITQAVNDELNKGYLSPKTAIDNLRTKLNFVGFDFDMKDVPATGSVSFPLKKATEVFGRGVEVDSFDIDYNDQSAISTGLTLTIKITQDEDSVYKLRGTIK